MWRECPFCSCDGWSFQDSDAWIANIYSFTCQVGLKLRVLQTRAKCYQCLCSDVGFCRSAYVTVVFCHTHIHQRLTNPLKFCYTIFGSFLSIPIQSSKLNLVDIFYWFILQCCENLWVISNCCLQPRSEWRARLAKRFKYCLLVDKSKGAFVVQAVLCKKASKWTRWWRRWLVFNEG